MRWPSGSGCGYPHREWEACSSRVPSPGSVQSRSSNSPRRRASAKAIHSSRVNVRMGLSGSFESRTATDPSNAANSTQDPPAQDAARCHILTPARSVTLQSPFAHEVPRATFAKASGRVDRPCERAKTPHTPIVAPPGARKSSFELAGNGSQPGRVNRIVTRCVTALVARRLGRARPARGAGTPLGMEPLRTADPGTNPRGAPRDRRRLESLDRRSAEA
jgi:hypothetical protein